MTASEDTVASVKAGDLDALSHRIHDNPELCFNEEKAHAWLTEFLEKHGAQTERSIGGLPTARADGPCRNGRGSEGPGAHRAGSSRVSRQTRAAKEEFAR